MTYDLLIGDRSYSSWSLRGWLLFDAFGLPVRVHLAPLDAPEFHAALADYAPARTVPVMRTAEGTVVPDTIAIAEELASRHPQAGIWPQAPAARAIARRLVAEMHAGFGALRGHCPMNLRTAYAARDLPPAVLADLARIEAIWAGAWEETGAAGPWLCGAYSAADAFFAPVAARVAGYGLPVGPQAAAYVAAHLAHGPFRRWRALALTGDPARSLYPQPLAPLPWPGPPPLPARAVEAGAVEAGVVKAGVVKAGVAENALCPYSGRPATHLLETGGRIFGFCNALCRDKTVADPEAWPAFMDLYHSVTTAA